MRVLVCASWIGLEGGQSGVDEFGVDVVDVGHGMFFIEVVGMCGGGDAFFVVGEGDSVGFGRFAEMLEFLGP